MSMGEWMCECMGDVWMGGWFIVLIGGWVNNLSDYVGLVEWVGESVSI